ncbi:peptidoglycan recognition family protein [Streptomyces glaucosporus]|uniref:Peptidoglycan recognition family protein n=1 Tax=Streptomyces glaucosporus TaxID=284044 RepID=A0ABN3IKM4_9ACTN
MNGEKSLHRRLLLAGAAGLAAAALPGAARAGAPDTDEPEAGEPDIDGTREWNARPPRESVDVLPYRPSGIVVHHTASPNTSDFSRARAHAHARWVQDVHLDDNEWIDTGYHFLVSRGGWITEGRHGSLRALRGGDDFVLGAHTVGQNVRTLGIAAEGSYHTGATPPQAQWKALVALCAYACARYGVRAEQIRGHADFGGTLCPGALQDMLPRLRDEAAAPPG